MKGITNKLKIILTCAIFIIFAAGMLLLGYGVMANRNQAIADMIALRRVELESLKREQKSFEQGKKDLAQLEASEHPPAELFSRDTKVVKEIQQLESAAQQFDLDLKISVTGTTKTAILVPNTNGELYSVPYNITLNGTFGSIVKFMQTAERLPFITHAKAVSINAFEKDQATAVLSSEFYIKK